MLPSLDPKTADRIRVLIADDRSTVRIGLQLFCLAYDDLEIVGEAADSLEAIELCIRFRPDVVLMDLFMPGPDGIKAIRAIGQRCPQTRIIAMIDLGEEKAERAALAAGAVLVLVKYISADDLAETIRTVHTGVTDNRIAGLTGG